MKKMLNIISDWIGWRNHCDDCLLNGDTPLAWDDWRCVREHREAVTERAYLRAVTNIECDLMSLPPVPERWTFSPGFVPIPLDAVRDELPPEEADYLAYESATF